MELFIINGPNLNLLGIRKPEVYGNTDYSLLCEMIRKHAEEKGIKVKIYQSNHEGKIVDKIHSCLGKADGIILNAAAYTHTSLAIGEAIEATGIPTVEVHISDPDEREDFRKVNFIRPYCMATVKGMGTEGYLKAIDLFLEKH